MTPLLVNLVARELREQLLSSRLSHISQSSPDIVHLTFYRPDQTSRHLVFALLPLKPLLFLSSLRTHALPKPPNFCASLRKHLEYAQLVEIADEPGEKIVHLFLKTPGGIYRLVFEGIPKYPNLILVGPDHNMISALRYKNDVERPVIPQAPYLPPPQPLDKPSFWQTEGDALRRSWEEAGKPRLGDWLKAGFRGCDQELAGLLESWGEDRFEKWDALKQTLSQKGWDRFTLRSSPSPSLRLFEEAPGGETESEIFSTPNPALERLFQLENHHRNFSAARTKLESEITKAVKHEKRILEKLKKDRAEAEKSDQYQWWGELLMAQLHKVKPHMNHVELEDIIRWTKAPLSIPLDPESTPLQNAQRFFKKAKKGSRGLALVEKREGEIKERLEHLKSAQRSLPALRGLEEIRQARSQLFPQVRETPLKPAKPKPQKVPTPNIIRRKLGKQFELCAGTSASANEYVTFQLAQPEDLWFHVRDLPGSHVLLRRLQREAPVTDDLVLQAAQLAASHSKAKPGTKVTVSYTEKKYVKRIPGAPTGMVSVSKERTLLVEV